MTYRRLAAFLAAIVLAATGCGDSEPAESTANTTTTTKITTTTAAPTTTTTTAPAPEHINFLTGLPDVNNNQSRPVAVMIANDSNTWGYQYGIDTADMLIEGETEGGITRIMAVWSDAGRMPGKVGPVRSARSPFVKLATALDTVYCHCGGSLGGKSALYNSGLAAIDNDGSTYWRDSYLAGAIDGWHNLLTSGKKVIATIDRRGIRQERNNPAPFVFGEKSGDKSAAKVQMTLSSSQTISFKYNDKDKLYYKQNGTLSGGKAHKTAEGKQLTAANVIVMYDYRYAEETPSTSSQGVYVYGYDMRSGSGKLMSGGKARDINWSRTDSGLTFTEADGTPLTVATGRTYLCFASSGYSSDLILQ